MSAYDLLEHAIFSHLKMQKDHANAVANGKYDDIIDYL